MDIATIMGILAFFAMAVATIYHSEGMAGFRPFANMEALLVVMGGTFCATLVNYPLGQVVGLGKILRKVLFSSGEDTSNIVTIFVTLSQKAKKEGFLSLQADIKNIPNDFMRKLDSAAEALRPEVLEGPADADLTLVSWGSSCGAARHVMRCLNEGRKTRVNFLPIRNLHPFRSEEVLAMLKRAKRVMAIEENFTAQLCRLIRMETGFDIVRRWLKYDGDPFDPEASVRRAEEALHD